MLMLNESHRNSLFALLQLLHYVVENKRSNKMSLESISTVMAPNLNVDLQHQHQQAFSNNSQQQGPFNSSNNNNFSQKMFKELGNGSRRMSMSTHSVNEISEEMAHFLRRTTDSLVVLKLLINLHNILFHVSANIVCLF